MLLKKKKFEINEYYYEYSYTFYDGKKKKMFKNFRSQNISVNE